MVRWGAAALHTGTKVGVPSARGWQKQGFALIIR